MTWFRPNLVLLLVAIAYPVVSVFVLRLVSGPFGVPDIGHWFLFSIVFPLGSIGIVILARREYPRLTGPAVLAFAIWIAFVGWCHHWVITELWASI